MPFYLYRVLLPGVEKDQCPTVEYQHSSDKVWHTDPETGAPLERIYTAPNLSKGYSEGHTRKLLEDKNLAQHGFTKYVRDPISQSYVKTAGAEGPSTFKVK